MKKIIIEIIKHIAFILMTVTVVILICFILIWDPGTINNKESNKESSYDGKYKYAIVETPDDGIIKGVIQELWYYDRSSQIEVKIDGIYYRSHSNNIILMSDKSNNINYK